MNIKLLDISKDIMKTKHYSYTTTQEYTNWIEKYILFHGDIDPKKIGKFEIEVFLKYLYKECKISKNMGKQALNAILFLHREIINIYVKSLNLFGLVQVEKDYKPFSLTMKDIRDIISKTMIL